MPRKGHTPKRTVDADPIYGSDLVTKFINSMMWQGKKSTAEGIFYKSLEKLKEKGGDEPLKLITKPEDNPKPLLGPNNRRGGGADPQAALAGGRDWRAEVARSRVLTHVHL